jgi:hypothetical protein
VAYLQAFFAQAGLATALPRLRTALNFAVIFKRLCEAHIKSSDVFQDPKWVNEFLPMAISILKSWDGNLNDSLRGTDLNDDRAKLLQLQFRLSQATKVALILLPKLTDDIVPWVISFEKRGFDIISPEFLYFEGALKLALSESYA